MLHSAQILLLQKYLELADQAKLRPVTTIGPVPSHVFMVNADMSESTRDALVDASH